MVWELLTLVVCGLLLGGLGRLAVPGRNALSWPRTLLLGLLGTVGAGLLTRMVLGQGHAVLTLLIALGLAALLLAGYSGIRHSRRLPPG